MDHTYHTPVLLDEVLSFLRPKEGGIYVDCTLGGGGHAEAVLDAISGKGMLVGFDRDPDAIRAAGERLARFVEPHEPRVYSRYQRWRSDER